MLFSNPQSIPWCIFSCSSDINAKRMFILRSDPSFTSLHRDKERKWATQHHDDGNVNLKWHLKITSFTVVSYSYLKHICYILMNFKREREANIS